MRIQYLVSGLVVATFLFVLPTTVNAAEDATAPRLTSFDISPTQVDTSESDQEVTITMSVTDDLSGNKYSPSASGGMDVRLSPLIGTQFKELYQFTLTSGDALNGTYQGKITIPKWSKSGVWAVDYVYLIDIVGNVREIHTNELGTMFPNSNITLANTQSDASVTIDKEWALSSPGTTVVFPKDTIVTRNDGGSFQFYKMVNQPFEIKSLPTTDQLTGATISAIRFGLPGMNISFSQAVGVSITVPTIYANQTLRIQTLKEGDTAWANETDCVVRYVGERKVLTAPDVLTGKDIKTKDGAGLLVEIPDPSDVDAYGVCTFSVNHASYYSISAKPYIVTGTKQAAAPVVRVFTSGGKLVKSFLAYTKTMHDGINVAVGDVNGDGANEIITSARTGGNPQIRVFDVSGKNLGWSFYAYDKTFLGGVNIAAGDTDGDGLAEISVAPMINSASDVKVFGFNNGKMVLELKKFTAYNNYRGGVAVSVGDIDGDGQGEIITTPTGSLSPTIRVFEKRNGKYASFASGVAAYASTFRGGVIIATGDVNGDGRDEIITGIISDGRPQIRIFGVGTNKNIVLQNNGFMANKVSFRGGVSLATTDVNDDGRDEIIAGVGSGGNPTIRIFDRLGKQVVSQFNAYLTKYQNGVTLAAGYFQ